MSNPYETISGLSAEVVRLEMERDKALDALEALHDAVFSLAPVDLIHETRVGQELGAAVEVLRKHGRLQAEGGAE